MPEFSIRDPVRFRVGQQEITGLVKKVITDRDPTEPDPYRPVKISMLIVEQDNTGFEFTVRPDMVRHFHDAF